jgi:site-specific DNA recombinase
MTTNPANGLAGWQPSTRPLRVAIYLRVSHESQAGKAAKAIKAGIASVLDLPDDENDKESLPKQERTSRAYAAERGWEVVGVYIEMDTSRHWEQRPQMRRLLADVRAGRVDVFLGWKLDRVLRDSTHLGVLLHQLKKAGCAFDLVLENVEDTPVGKFLLNALAFAAEIERENFRLRSQVGIEGRLEAGRIPRGCKRPPYGYAWNEDRSAYVVRPDEAPILQRIFRDYLDGASLMTIADALDAEHVPTGWGGARWRRSTLRGILRNETYAGHYFAN